MLFDLSAILNSGFNWHATKWNETNELYTFTACYKTLYTKRIKRLFQHKAHTLTHTNKHKTGCDHRMRANYWTFAESYGSIRKRNGEQQQKQRTFKWKGKQKMPSLEQMNAMTGIGWHFITLAKE